MSKKKIVKTIVKKRVIAKDKAGDKVSRVMAEFKEGKLLSSSGGKVTDKKQALAIALSEAGLSKSVFKAFDKVEVVNKIRVMKSILENKIQKEQANQQGIDNKIIEFMIKTPSYNSRELGVLADKIGMTPEQVNEKIYSIFSNLLSGGNSRGVDIEMNELKLGISEEREHTNNDLVAGVLATKHLVKNPHYYSRMKEIEPRLEEKELFAGKSVIKK